MPARVRDDRQLRREALDVLRLFCQEAHRDEQRERQRLVIGGFELGVQDLLDVLPQRPAVGFDNHRAAHGAVVSQIRLDDDIVVPLVEILRSGRDAEIVFFLGHKRLEFNAFLA